MAHAAAKRTFVTNLGRATDGATVAHTSAAPTHNTYDRRMDVDTQPENGRTSPPKSSRSRYGRANWSITGRSITKASIEVKRIAEEGRAARFWQRVGIPGVSDT